jgi:isoleucyl-tRNA synthetase
VADPELREVHLERQVADVRRAVALGMAVREREGIAVRRPLSAATIASGDPSLREAVRELESDVLGELNVKALNVAEDDRDLVTVEARANFKVLGGRLAGKMQMVADALRELDDATLRHGLSCSRVEVAGETLAPEEIVLVRKPRPGRATASAEGVTVVLETTLTQELYDEGLAREIVNRVQNLRRRAGLDVSQKIALGLVCGGALAAALARRDVVELLRAETLADSVRRWPPGADHGLRHVARDTIDVEPVEIGLEALA